MLRTAGPLGVLLSFIFLTVLAWGVMHFITDIISIWPVRGALVDFVRYFVDEDLALTVGAAYWSVDMRNAFPITAFAKLSNQHAFRIFINY